jgi:hypothetical protein
MGAPSTEQQRGLPRTPPLTQHTPRTPPTLPGNGRRRGAICNSSDVEARPTEVDNRITRGRQLLGGQDAQILGIGDMREMPVDQECRRDATVGRGRWKGGSSSDQAVLGVWIRMGRIRRSRSVVERSPKGQMAGTAARRMRRGPMPARFSNRNAPSVLPLVPTEVRLGRHASPRASLAYRAASCRENPHARPSSPIVLPSLSAAANTARRASCRQRSTRFRASFT